MSLNSLTFALESGLDLSQVVTTGSVLHINEDYCDNVPIESEKSVSEPVNFIGRPVSDFKKLEKTMLSLDENGFVKKKILEEGGGLPLQDSNTVSIAFSAYWEDSLEPFDTRNILKPLVIDLKDSGLLPGFEKAIRSMIVGETSMFLFTYHLMYGEMGVPPRIKPKASCVFYIKLMKSVLTSNQGKIDFSEPNMFQRVHHEVKMLYSSGVTLYKTNNFTAAIQLFRKAVFMLHKCRLADETEEQIQEKLLIKIYLNLAICYNNTKQPLKACTACNELSRLNSLWNNGKALYQNAKSLRMIGQFDAAEKRLRRAMKLCSKNEMSYLEAELELLLKTKEACNQSKLIANNTIRTKTDLVSEEFRREVDNLIKNFKENVDLCKLVMPSGLTATEVAYIKNTCIKENLFFNKIKNFDKEDNTSHEEDKKKVEFAENFALDKNDCDNLAENFALDKNDCDDLAENFALDKSDCDDLIIL